MAYKRRSFKIITEAQQHATNLKAIDPNLDLGGSLTVAALTTKSKRYRPL
jgi:hypothetical protein